MGILGTLKSAMASKPLEGTTFEEGAAWIGVKYIGHAAESDTDEYWMANTALPQIEKKSVYLGTLEAGNNCVVVKINGKAIGTLPSQFARDALKVVKKQGGQARCAIKAASSTAKTQTMYIRK